ncbi:unnamed protein product [Ranitomeya imitator]|uniref:Uncharacterized protein n=1 Tax=Ranitomeya imitator TaxID=111125 RepID=A0ABN9LPE0_9NEOB|nr:unnamed protein product [Ranitomeya imitator]
MEEGGSGGDIDSRLRDKASAITFLDPGLKHLRDRGPRRLVLESPVSGDVLEAPRETVDLNAQGVGLSWEGLESCKHLVRVLVDEMARLMFCPGYLLNLDLRRGPTLTEPFYVQKPFGFHLGLEDQSQWILMVDLPPSEEMTVILVTDRLTKMADFIPTKGIPTAEETAELVVKEVFRLHGIPDNPEDSPVFHVSFHEELSLLLHQKKSMVKKSTSWMKFWSLEDVEETTIFGAMEGVTDQKTMYGNHRATSMHPGLQELFIFIKRSQHLRYQEAILEGGEYCTDPNPAAPEHQTQLFPKLFSSLDCSVLTQILAQFVLKDKTKQNKLITILGSSAESPPLLSFFIIVCSTDVTLISLQSISELSGLEQPMPSSTEPLSALIGCSDINCHYPVPPSVSVIILYPECQCHYPVPRVSVPLSCTPSVSAIILYPECQCHHPVPRVSVSLSCTPSVSVIILYPQCQCHYPVPTVSVSLSCTPSVSVIILYPQCQCHYPVLRVSVSLSCTPSVSVIILYPHLVDEMARLMFCPGYLLNLDLRRGPTLTEPFYVQKPFGEYWTPKNFFPMIKEGYQTDFFLIHPSEDIDLSFKEGSWMQNHQTLYMSLNLLDLKSSNLSTILNNENSITTTSVFLVA